jgi:hypothetical protein
MKQKVGQHVNLNDVGRSMKMALLLLFLAATVGEAKTRDWKDAKVTDVSETIVSTASWGDTNIRHYTIETDDMVYVLDYAYNPAVKAPWPGQHSKNRAPDVTVNSKTKIAIEGKDAYILDDTGREVKLPIAKKTKK